MGNTVFAGAPVLAADHNGLIEREGQAKLVTDSATWSNSPEVAVATVTISAVEGDLYKIWFTGKVSTDVGGDSCNMRIREDSGISGTQLQLQQVYLPTASGNGYQAFIYAEWRAPATDSKTFTLTAQRSAGTGTAHRVRASASAPGLFNAEKITENS